MNIFFHAHHRCSHKPKQYFCTNIKQFSISSFFAPTLFSSANIIFSLFLAFILRTPWHVYLRSQTTPIPKSTTPPLPDILSFSPSRYTLLHFLLTQHHVSLPATSHLAVFAKKGFCSPSLSFLPFLFLFRPLFLYLFLPRSYQRSFCFPLSTLLYITYTAKNHCGVTLSFWNTIHL